MRSITQFFLNRKAKWAFYAFQATVIVLALFGSIASCVVGVISFYRPDAPFVIPYNTVVSQVACPPLSFFSTSFTDGALSRLLIASGCGPAQSPIAQSRLRSRTTCANGSQTSTKRPTRFFVDSC